MTEQKGTELKEFRLPNDKRLKLDDAAALEALIKPLLASIDAKEQINRLVIKGH